MRALIYEVSVSQDEAASIIYRREIDAIGSGRVYCEPAPDRKNAVRIDQIVGLAGQQSVHAFCQISEKP